MISRSPLVQAAPIAVRTPTRAVALDRDACVRHLTQCEVGRVALSVNALPAIFPVHYAVVGGDIVFRASHDDVTAGSVVAFEVDYTDVTTATGWSVMVVGPARRIVDPEAIAHAETLGLVGWDGGGDSGFVRVEATLVTGREVRDS